MTAKEMFEALGYECINSDDFYLNYVKIFKENGVQYEIEFSLEEKEVIITPTCFIEDNKPIYFVQLDGDTIQAINQQCKQLGWLDE